MAEYCVVDSSKLSVTVGKILSTNHYEINLGCCHLKNLHLSIKNIKAHI